MAIHPYIVNQVRTPTIHSAYHAQFQEWIWMERAHGMMLVKQGLLPEVIWEEIREGLDKVRENLTEEELDGRQVDIYNVITQKLYREIGEEMGCRLHVGRSRNDMYAACSRMQLRRELLEITGKIGEVMETILKTAEENIDTVITYYTYGQPAQPGTYAHYLMLLFELFARDYIRFQAAYKNVNRSPMGAATGIGTQFPLDPHYTAELLGFDGVIGHSLDAISGSDCLLEAECAMAVMSTNLSKAAQDFIFWSSYEYRLMDGDFSICSASSIMPQKKNQICNEMLRIRSGHAVGLLADSFTLVRNTSLFPNNESNTDIFLAFEAGFQETMRSLGLLQVILENTQIRKKESYSYTGNNFTGASTMAECLAQEYQVPFTQTHHIVGGMIRRLMDADKMDIRYLTGRMMEEVSREVLGQGILMTDRQVQEMMDPVFCLDCKVTGGTPKREDMEEMLRNGRETLEIQAGWHHSCTQKLEAAKRRVS